MAMDHKLKVYFKKNMIKDFRGKTTFKITYRLNIGSVLTKL